MSLSKKVKRNKNVKLARMVEKYKSLQSKEVQMALARGEAAMKVANEHNCECGEECQQCDCSKGENCG